MLIPAIRLTPYLEKLFKDLSPAPSKSFGAVCGPLVPAKLASGSPWRDLSLADVQILADENMVFGRGSDSKLKYVKLDVAPEVAEEALTRARSRPAAASVVRERLQNPQSSQTIWNQPITTPRIAFKQHKHVRNDGFGSQARLEYQ